MPNRISDATDFEVGYAIGFLSAQNEQFSTINIIRKIIGSYYCDEGTPAGSSQNALFGKRLSANEQRYRIKRVLPDEPSKDDSDRPTTTAIWRRAQ